MPTVDTYGNINSGTKKKSDYIDFYQTGKPELNIELMPQATSKFRILDNDNESGSNEIFRNMIGNGDTPCRTPSITTSVNTTILGPNGGKIQKEDNCKILNPSFHEKSSYEQSIEKGLIRNQVKHLNL
jgi:hypothetical protein